MTRRHGAVDNWRFSVFITLVVLLALSLLGNILQGGINVFLIKEALKKFNFMRLLIRDGDCYSVLWHYPGAQEAKHVPGMRTVVLRSTSYFSALIGFRLDIKARDYAGYNPYGFVKAEPDGDSWKVVISTYCGTDPKDFIFMFGPKRTNVTVTSEEVDQQETPRVVYPPHWWQRWGIYG